MDEYSLIWTLNLLACLIANVLWFLFGYVKWTKIMEYHFVFLFFLAFPFMGFIHFVSTDVYDFATCFLEYVYLYFFSRVVILIGLHLVDIQVGSLGFVGKNLIWVLFVFKELY